MAIHTAKFIVNSVTKEPVEYPILRFKSLLFGSLDIGFYYILPTFMMYHRGNLIHV